MAALCAGSYGLSQQHQPQNTNDNKERIFVKLTDSALRAIEEFQRNQLKLGSTLNPSIQFVNGGEGYLSFPSSGNNVQKFSFSISDIDGGGSIECIQQNQGQQLQNMGHIQHKMRIHANDDVYERTRHRMAAVEETQKNKCTREIKPNQTDIGRKVKLKNTTTRISNIPSSNSVLSKRDSLHSSSNNYSSNNNNNNNNNNSNHNNNHNGSSNAVVNSSSSLLNPALASNNQHHQQQQQQQHQNHNGGLLSSSAVAAATANNNGNNYNNQHLSTSPKLPKSNGLHNNHHYSNGSSNNNQSAQPKPGYQHTVHDPPHQQQQQQQKSETNGVVSSRTANGRASKDTGNPNLMKRNIKRKPQNLTPPLSSDGGSSTSGQSPSSTHNGSSPPSGGKRSSIANNEEPGVGSAPTSKKPRISHYKKEALPDTNRRGVTDSRDSSNMNPRSRQPDDSTRSSNPNQNHNNHQNNHNYHHHHHNNHHGSSVTPNAQESEDSGVSLSYSLVSNDVARRIQHPAKDEKDRDDVISERDNYDDQINAYRANTNKVKSLKDDFSDQFTRITSVEQRRKYKTEFDNDFQEYRRLHEIVERVSRKFAQLEENLQHERHNERRYKEIQRQIIKEYDESIKDNKFQETKQRFNYLHNKLSHIKHLVHDYDVAITNGHCRPQENY
ncbi:RNA polymerase II elongation factor ELL isoform X3 [Ochlerotatus camptorhynchus]|uniref:RNA polymerase II elongation factor ELL isoform X3 n=1 Tax=Ochlerotatus camptorhynchus TaxID=644619 RepID=UPI0031CE4623